MKTATAKDVHKQFDIEAASLIKEANKIIDASKQKQNALALKMKSLGFGNSVSIQDNIDAIKNANTTLSYTLLYPQNNFLTESSIETICKKYGLLMAKSTDFIGEIPIKNQMEVSEFKLAESEIKINVIDKEEFKKNIKELKRCIKEAKNKKIDFFSLFSGLWDYVKINEIRRKFEKTITKKEYLKGNPNYSFRSEVKPEFMIVATPDNLNLSNKEIIGEYKLIDTDPVVLCKVEGGYIQVACWGDELNINEFKTATKN